MAGVLITVAGDEWAIPAPPEQLRRVPVKRPAKSVRPPAPVLGGAPRLLRSQLEDEFRAQGADVRKVLKSSWVGRCTECPKYEYGICMYNKKEMFNPIAPGREGVCQLRHRDGSFKRRRHS